MNKEGKYEIYTDGGCQPNPGKGGFGVVVFDPEGTLINWYSSWSPATTNNEMELSAIKYAMDYVEENLLPANCIIYTDSAYSLNCITQWAPTWSCNGWMTTKKQPVLNKDLIEDIYNKYNTNFMNTQVELQKVKGHVGTIGNELADRLAVQDFRKFVELAYKNCKISKDCKMPYSYTLDNE